jgi:uncharacterized protein (TIGR02594 family)
MYTHILWTSLILTSLVACTDAESIPFPDLRGEVPIIVSAENPALTAYNYYGLHEQDNREELQTLTGIDPVHTEWCAAFVNGVLEESGIPGSESVSEYPLMARSFLTWGEKISKEDINAGDIVVLPRGDASWQGHVGFYVRTIERAGVTYYAILGGNQSNKVSIELYRASRVLGIRRYNLDNLLVP